MKPYTKFYIYGGALLVIVYLVMARFALAPMIDFTIDDWFLLSDTRNVSYGEIMRTAGLDIYRPIGTGYYYTLARLIGDNPLYFTLYKLVISSAGALIVLVLSYMYTRNYATAVLATAIFSVLPNIHEPYGYGIQFAGMTFRIFMVGSLVLWEVYLRTPKLKYAVLAFLAFLPMAGGETAVFMSPYFVCRTFFSRTDKKSLALSLLFPAVGVLYLVWRFTGGFGFGQHTFIDGQYFGASERSIMHVIQCARRIVSWWFGGLFLDTFVSGLASFRTLLPKFQIMLVAAVSGMTVILLFFLRSRPEAMPDKKPLPGVMPSLLIFAALSYGPFLLFPAGARHNSYAAIALSILFAMLIMRKPTSERLLGIFVILLMMTLSSAGLAKNWRESGVFHRNTYEHLAATESEWAGSSYVLIDTGDLRQRLTPGLHAQATAWDFFGGAGLPRGWVYWSMMRLIRGESVPRVILDAESGAKWEGDTLHWHERFNASVPYETSRQDVYVLDAYRSGTGAWR